MKKAFTLLELLIVVIIIAVLVAIAAPSYYNAVQKAKDSEAKGALAELRKVFIAYHSITNSYYPSISNGDLLTVDMDSDLIPEITVAVPKSSNYTYSTDGATYIKAAAPAGGTSWQIDISSGAMSNP
jgi:type IV pilus assembly protein PilA